MNAANKSLLLILFLCVGISLHAQSDLPSDRFIKLQNKYKEFLIEKGFKPEIDSDGDIEFEFNEQFYYILIDEADPRLLQLVTFGQLDLDSTTDREEAIRICHDITAELTVTKAFLSDDLLYCSTEVWYNDADDFKGIFDRCLKETEKAYEMFLSKW